MIKNKKKKKSSLKIKDNVPLFARLIFSSNSSELSFPKIFKNEKIFIAKETMLGKDVRILERELLGCPKLLEVYS